MTGIFRDAAHHPENRSVGPKATVRRDEVGAMSVAGDVAAVGARSAVHVRLSDQALRELACKVLAKRTELSARPIRIAVRQSWVTLTGEVNGAWEKSLAEKAIQQISGVKGISNSLIFESEALAWKISQRIGDSFVRTAEAAAQRIMVNVHDRRVILCGTVCSQRERDAAYAAAWTVSGVADVVNRLHVRTPDGTVR